MNDQSLDGILGSFDPTTEAGERVKDGKPIGIWLSPKYFEKYHRLQRITDRRFCKTLRKIIQAAIDKTESKAS